MHRTRLPIAEPCSERYDAMTGEGAHRFCDECRISVHDLSQMTPEGGASDVGEMGDVEVPALEDTNFLMGLVSPEPDPAEGCPVPPPGTEDSEFMGRVLLSPAGLREQRRVERRWKREQRRQARGERRSGGL